MLVAVAVEGAVDSMAELSQAQNEYVAWMLTPPAYREPRDKIAFAAKFGVHRRTLYNWERSSWFAQRIRAEKGHMSASWLGDILGRLKMIVDSGPEKDAVAAARVLLGYLDVPEESGSRIDDEALKEALRAAGIKVEA